MQIMRLAFVGLLLLGSTLWASVGKVALVKGEASALRDTQKILLQNGAVLEEKDTITTAKDAQIQLLFEDKTVITLGSESEFKIEEYLNDATNPKAKFKFNQGSFKTITGQIGKTAPQNFTMETKTATIGIRGTIVKGQIRQDGDIIACLRGLITVMSRHTGNVVDVPAGQFTTIKGNQSPTTPQETTPGTTDESLANTTPSPTSSTPTTVASVEQTKNDTIIQSNYSPQGLQTGVLAIEGLATMWDSSSVPFNFSINRATAQTTGQIGQVRDECATYSLATSSNGLSQTYSENGFTVAAYIDLDTYDNTEDYAPNFAYYVNDELFMRGGFIPSYQEEYQSFDWTSSPMGYFGTASLNGIDSTSSQYVTWGIWGTDYVYEDNIPLSGEQYWVGGPTITPESKIQALMVQGETYTYTGQVLGKIFNLGSWSQIDTATSNVNLIFNFGSTSTINSASSISFKSILGGDSWVLKPTSSSVTTTGFTSSVSTGTNGGNVNIGSGAINGKFFGSDAQAVGGTLNAISLDLMKETVGVFKAVR